MERLMLKDKEVVADPQRQYEIARAVHKGQHGGINKTTATIAEKYHWVRIKETVSLVIKNCPDCKESTKLPSSASTGGRPTSDNNNHTSSTTSTASSSSSALAQLRRAAHQDPNSMIERLVNFDNLQSPSSTSSATSTHHRDFSAALDAQSAAPVAHMHPLHAYADMPLDPQIMQDQHFGSGAAFGAHEHGQEGFVHHHHHHHHHHDNREPFLEGQSDHSYNHCAPAPDHDPEPGHETGYGGDMALDHEEGETGRKADTRMATERHVSRGDEPMGFVQEGV